MMEPLRNLEQCLAKLPGIGRRSASRIAASLMRDGDLSQSLAAALRDARERVRACSRCGTLTASGKDPCRLCSDPSRDTSILCIVEDPNDIVLIESSGAFQGRYHSLMGRLSPMKGTGPRDLRISTLLSRVKEEGVAEVLLALNTDVESEATANYLLELLRDSGVRVTRLAYGIPAGSGIMYSDPVTLERAIKGRQGM